MRIQDLPEWPPSAWFGCISHMGKALPDHFKAVVESVEVDKDFVCLCVKEDDASYSTSLPVGNRDLATKVSRALSGAIGKTIKEAGQITIPDK